MGRALARAVAAFRFVALGYVAVLVVVNHDDYSRPGLGWVLLGVMALWTGITFRHVREVSTLAVVAGRD